MKHRIIALILFLTLLLSGCQSAVSDNASAASGEASDEYICTPDTTITFSKTNAVIAGPGATVDDGEVLIVAGGIYELTGSMVGCRVKVEAGTQDDVTLLLNGISLTNTADEAIYAKTAGSLTVIAAAGTNNTLTSGIASELDANAGTDSSGAALRANCPMTLSGTGTLSVNGYINNGVAAEGDLTMDGITLSVISANDGVKSDAAVTVLSGTYAVTSRHDAFQAGTDLTFEDGAVTVFTGVGSTEADMKIGDSSMMGNMGGGPGGGGGVDRTVDLSGIDFDALGIDLTAVDLSSLDLSEEAIEKLGLTGADLTCADLSGLDLSNINLDDYGLRRRDITSLLNVSSDELTAVRTNENSGRGEASGNTADAEQSPAPGEAGTDGADTADGEQSQQGGASREQRTGGMMPGMGGASGETGDEAEDTVSDSAKGLKAENSITVSGGCFLLDCEDDAVHSDGTVVISGGELTITSGDDGIHGNDRLTITGGSIDIRKSFEGLEANIILIDDGIISIVASDDGMNASGGGFGMMWGGSSEASGETEEDETDTTASADLTETASAETDSDDDLEGPLLRIRGGVITVDSGGDGLDSNGSFYLMGGTVFVSGPSTDWDAPVDTGEGSSQFLITGGSLMAAGYSGMAETPGRDDSAQCSIYYTTDSTVPDGALCTLSDTAGNILMQYSFVHSYNCVILSSPALTVGETYILTVDGTDYEIELTDTLFSTRGSSGEMGGFPGR